MTTYVDVIARKDTITIDGYTSNKTERTYIAKKQERNYIH